MDRRRQQGAGIRRNAVAADDQAETQSGGREIVSLSAVRKQREKERYADLVMKVWDDWEHADKRALLDKKGEVQIKARERL